MGREESEESCEKVDAVIIEALKRTDYPQSG